MQINFVHILYLFYKDYMSFLFWEMQIKFAHFLF